MSKSVVTLNDNIFSGHINSIRDTFREKDFNWSEAPLLLDDKRTDFKVFHYLIEAMFAKGEKVISLDTILEKLESFVGVADGNSIAVFVNLLLQPAQEEIVTQVYLERIYNFYHGNKIDNGLKADAIWRSFLFHSNFGEALSRRLWEDHSDSFLLFMTSLLEEYRWYLDSDDLARFPDFVVVEMYMHNEILKTFVLGWGNNNPTVWLPLAKKIVEKLYPGQDINSLPQGWVLSLVETY